VGLFFFFFSLELLKYFLVPLLFRGMEPIFFCFFFFGGPCLWCEAHVLLPLFFDNYYVLDKAFLAGRAGRRAFCLFVGRGGVVWGGFCGAGFVCGGLLFLYGNGAFSVLLVATNLMEDVFVLQMLHSLFEATSPPLPGHRRVGPLLRLAH